MSARKKKKKTTYNKAKSEKGPALDDSTRHVATVVALADDALIALDLGAKGVFAADKEEEDHGGQSQRGEGGKKPRTMPKKRSKMGESR